MMFPINFSLATLFIVFLSIVISSYILFIIKTLIFGRIKYNSNNITVGNKNINWQDILSISTTLGGIFRPFYPYGIIYIFQIKTSNKTYTGHVLLNISNFIDSIQRTNIFEICQTDLGKHPLRWKRIGTKYNRTGMLDWFMDQEYIFFQNDNSSNEGTKTNNWIAIVLILLFILFIIFMFYQALIPS